MNAVQVIVATAAEVESGFNSVERIANYADPDVVPQEPPSVLPDCRPPPSWPSCGRLGFEGVALRYRTGPLVLEKVSFEVESGEKVGICGRTGSGKSSLMVGCVAMLLPSLGICLPQTLETQCLPP